MTTSQTTAAVSNPRPSSQWLITLVGVALLIIGCFLSWSYVPALLGNLSVNFFPGAIQIFMIIVGVLGLFFLLLRKGLFPGAHKLLDSARGLRALSVTAAAFMVLVVIVIGLQAPGLANADPGVFVTLVGALAMVAGSFRMPSDPTVDPITVHLPSWVEILVIVAMLTVVLFGAAYALGQEDGTVFSLFLLFLAGLVVALARAGLFSWFGVIAQRNRRVIMLGAFAVAFLFPFTQNGSDANMSIATQVLIFATTALGLNIVVGLAGLLDLGYIAFLGAGAYVSAMMSHSAFANIGWKPPFLVVVIISAIVSSVLGLIIGSPTLRVSGDYLAIVTLAFGEIFRLTVNNLDGNNGPDLTNGPNGIPGIPSWRSGRSTSVTRTTFLASRWAGSPTTTSCSLSWPPSSSPSSPGSTTAGSAGAGSPSARTRRLLKPWASTSSGSSSSPSLAAPSSRGWPGRSRRTRMCR
jgi:branched-chain amino acid transport system permease protein